MARRSSRGKAVRGRGPGRSSARPAGPPDCRRATDRVPALVDEPRAGSQRRAAPGASSRRETRSDRGRRGGESSRSSTRSETRSSRRSRRQDASGDRRGSRRQEAGGDRRRSARQAADDSGGRGSSRRGSARSARGRAKQQNTVLIIGAVSAVLILVIGLAVILGTGMVGGGGDAGSGPVEPRTLLGRMQQAIRSEDLGRIERVEAEYKRLIDGVTSGRIPKPPDFQRIQAMSRGLRDAKSKLTAP